VIEIMKLLQLVPQGVLLCDTPFLLLLLCVLVPSLVCILYVCQADTKKTCICLFLLVICSLADV